MKKSILIFSLLLLVCSFPMNTFGECIKGDCQNGQGTYTFPDGEKYVGEWENNKKHGQGTYTFPDGSKYEGEFRERLPNGQGTTPSLVVQNMKVNSGMVNMMDKGFTSFLVVQNM